jgi:hypothetical protein
MRLLLLLCIFVASESDAQTRTNGSATVASSSSGQVGQRQTRDIAGQEAKIEPMARIDNRIQNRVQTRIRNRIDRFYDPQANAKSPFEIAGDEARKAGRGRRR